MIILLGGYILSDWIFELSLRQLLAQLTSPISYAFAVLWFLSSNNIRTHYTASTTSTPSSVIATRVERHRVVLVLFASEFLIVEGIV
jgi:hypothetical protein